MGVDSVDYRMVRFADRARLGRLAGLVVVSTVGLTASFIGLVALASGAVDGAVARLPAYVLSMAFTFVGGIVVFEESRHQGRRALWAAGSVAVVAFLVVGLGGEGVVYAIDHPDEVLGSQIFAYLLSAGLMGTGFGYWGWRNWRSLRTTGLADAL